MSGRRARALRRLSRVAPAVETPADAPRCRHELLACRRCRTEAPGQNRFRPGGPIPPRESSNRPVLHLVRNRADKRALYRAPRPAARR